MHPVCLKPQGSIGIQVDLEMPSSPTHFCAETSKTPDIFKKAVTLQAASDRNEERKESKMDKSHTEIATTESSISTISANVETVKKAHFIFKHSKDLSLLPAATISLQKLELAYRAITNCGKKDEISKMKKDYDSCHALVQEMNMASPVCTVQDIRNLSSFVTPPIEKIYVDPTTKQEYQNPDHSKLLALTIPFFQTNHFKGTGLNRHQRLLNPATNKLEPCDMVYLTKTKEQMAYDSCDYSNLNRFQLAMKHGKGAFMWPSEDEMGKTIIQRHTSIQKAREFLNKQIEVWGYSSYVIGTNDELEKVGLSKETASKLCAIVLFYKPIST